MFEPKIISVYISIFCCIKINLLWFSLKIFIGGKIKSFLNPENAKWLSMIEFRAYGHKTLFFIFQISIQKLKRTLITWTKMLRRWGLWLRSRNTNEIFFYYSRWFYLSTLKKRHGHIISVVSFLIFDVLF